MSAGIGCTNSTRDCSKRINFTGSLPKTDGIYGWTIRYRRIYIVGKCTKIDMLRNTLSQMYQLLEKIWSTREEATVVKLCSPYLGWHYWNVRSGFLRFITTKVDPTLGSTFFKLILFVSCGIEISFFNLYDKSPETPWKLRSLPSSRQASRDRTICTLSASSG